MTFEEPSAGPLYPEQLVSAERALVALALFNSGHYLCDGVEGRMFFNPRLGLLWTVSRSMADAGKEVNIVTVADELARMARLEPVGGLAYLSGLALDAAVLELAERYAEVIKEAYTGRELRRLASEVPHALEHGSSVQEVADRLRAFIDNLEAVHEQSATTLDKEIAQECVRIADDIKLIQEGTSPETGLPSGLGLENVVPGGIPRDRLTLIFGETGTYKTAIKQWMCNSIAAAGYYVLDFTLEDSAELTAQRFLARVTGIPYGRIAARQLSTPEVETLNQWETTAQEVAKRTIVVGNVPATIEEAIRLSRYWARKVDLAAVFVDYVQLLETGRRDNEAQALLEICKKAQRAAHRDKLAWVLISQMNRRYADREDKRPVLSDLYGGSAIGHTTKLAIGIYRPYTYEHEPEKGVWKEMYDNAYKGTEKYKGALELWVRKNVAGEANVCCNVLVDPSTGRITPV